METEGRVNVSANPLKPHDYTYFAAVHDRFTLLTISAEDTCRISLYLVLLSFLITMVDTRSISLAIVRMLNGKTRWENQALRVELAQTSLGRKNGATSWFTAT
jgi:hypothetical protein